MNRNKVCLRILEVGGKIYAKWWQSTCNVYVYSGMGAFGGHCLQYCPTDQNVKLDFDYFFSVMNTRLARARKCMQFQVNYNQTGIAVLGLDSFGLPIAHMERIVR